MSAEILELNGRIFVACHDLIVEADSVRAVSAEPSQPNLFLKSEEVIGLTNETATAIVSLLKTLQQPQKG
jgi:hypothetical protein